jgi:hypothetical protein
MSEDGFRAYVGALGLRHVYSAEQHEGLHLSFRVPCDEPWWNPTDSLDGAHFDHTPGEDHFAIAKYENGHAYFAALAW